MNKHIMRIPLSVISKAAIGVGT